MSSPSDGDHVPFPTSQPPALPVYVLKPSAIQQNSLTVFSSQMDAADVLAASSSSFHIFSLFSLKILVSFSGPATPASFFILCLIFPSLSRSTSATHWPLWPM